jgi:hypothetical protein
MLVMENSLQNEDKTFGVKLAIRIPMVNAGNFAAAVVSGLKRS